ncbi:hypothetical protein HDU76_006941 [Blyttiomyces sp. JEL0837]|nr:hypothetical protein HDU76_006941 [Blyttiomyces sp. JEL0837]
MFGPVPEDTSVEIFRQCCETVMYLHEMGYYHNDIKDENILINTKTRQVKLIDFGSATAITSENETCQLFYGTKKFAAPEAVRGEPYKPDAQEAWALGTLFFVLLFKLDPFTNDQEILNTDIVKRIHKFRNAMNERVSTVTSGSGGGGGHVVSDYAVDALQHMMEKDPEKRIKVKDILDLPVFYKF